VKKIYMEKALKQAQKALKKGEIPIGAVIVKDDKIIATAYNQKEKTKNAINHAEIIAIKRACKKINDWRLNECELYVTLEPCMMCLGAAQQARIKKIYFGTPQKKIYNLKNDNNLIAIQDTEIQKNCSNLLKMFFKNKRD